MTPWLNFAETIEELNIMERDVLPLLNQGLQPYLRYAPKEPMYCPSKHHEYFILANEFEDTKDKIEELRKFRAILTQVQKEGSVVIDQYRLLVLTIVKLEQIIPNEQRESIIPIEKNIELTRENTAWITEDVLNRLENDLTTRWKAISKRCGEIDQDDPHRIAWKYFIGPYLGELDWNRLLFSEEPSPVWLKDIWPDEEIENIVSELRKCYFRAEDVEKFANLQKEAQEMLKETFQTKTKYLSFQEVLDELNLKEFQIFPYLKKGLQPYEYGGKVKVKCPPKHHEYFFRLEQQLPRLNPLTQKGLRKILCNRAFEITHDDPEAVSWKYLIEPQNPEDALALIEDLRGKYFKREDVERVKGIFSVLSETVPPMKAQATPWYLWNENSGVLTITATQEPLQFNLMGAKVISLFDKAYKTRKPGDEYAELSLSYIRNALAIKDADGNIINPGYARDMGSFFQKQPWWKKVLHTAPEIRVRRGLYRFAPPRSKSRFTHPH